MKQFLFLVFFVQLSIPAFAQKTLGDLLSQHNTQNIPYISVDELRRLQLKSEVLILDAREEDEFNVSHLPTAIFIGYSKFSRKENVLKNIPKNIPIVVYCSVGIRSETIADRLKKSGFTQIRNLYGGIFEWKNKGYPVFDTLGKETQKVHAYSKKWGKWLKKGEKVF